MATSDYTRDYMARTLQNEDPGTTDPVRDYEGRNTTDTDDYMGRDLTALNPGSISGTVTESEESDPIVGATVSAGDQEATTDESGEYTITGLAPGEYTVTATADGYDPDEATGVTVTPGDDTPDVDFELVASE